MFSMPDTHDRRPELAHGHEATFGEGNQPSDRGVIRSFAMTRIAAGADSLVPGIIFRGTKMTFAGLSSETQRADIIAYLRTLSDNPLPPPTAPNTAAAPAGSKPNEQAPAQKKGS